MRMIDADELSAIMYHEAFETDSDMQKWDGGCWIRYKMFEKAIDSVPTIEAEPERRKGRWININDSEKYQCSECGITMWFPKSLDITPDTYIFCPHCGAKMNEEKEK